MRKIDIKLIPFLALLYLLSFLDRSNIGNARLDTLEKDLGLNSARLQYNHALAIFFPFYVAAEIPSNMIMKQFQPSIWIPSLMIAWGLRTTLMGIVKDCSGLLVARSATLVRLAEHPDISQRASALTYCRRNKSLATGGQ